MNNRLKQIKQQVFASKLIKNSIYLMASAAVLALLGFGFWLFVAHLYTPAQIGVASALMAITAIIANLSMLGVNSGLMRFLAGSKDQSRDINAAIILVAVVTMLASGIYVILGQLLGFQIPLVVEPWQKVVFIFLMSAISVNSLTDAVFIANRRAEFHTAGYAALGLVKLILPLFFVGFGATGIFAAYIIAVMVSLVLSVILMKHTCDYKLLAPPDWSFLNKVKKYALNNYIGVIFGGLPSQLMPILILQRLSADSVAYFSIAWTMANLIYVIPSAVSQSMLAESSHDIQKKSIHIQHTVRIIALVLVPAVLVALVIAPYLLGIFGAQYSAGSTGIFQVLVLAAFSVAVNEVCGSILNIEHRSTGIVVAQFCNATVTLTSAIFLLRFGLTGAGIALVLGSLASNISHGIFFKFKPDVRIAGRFRRLVRR
jgi:O-antigen/teichoic acid export membrane protein